MKKFLVISLISVFILTVFSNFSIAVNANNPIEDGTYEITSTINSNIAFDITDGSYNDGAPIQLWQNYHVTQQKFIIKSNNNGYYTIKSAKTGKYLSVENENPSWGNKIVQKTANGKTSQEWAIKRKSNNTYNIVSRCGNLDIDVPNWNCNNGVKLQLWGNNESATSQRFILNKVEDENSKNLGEGTYQIVSSINRNISFDIESGSLQNGAKLQLWDNVYAEQQKFVLEYVDEGYYRIKSKYSGKYLTIENNNTSWGRKIVQQDKNNLDTQKWKFKKASDGSYNIVSKIDGIHIDIPNWNCNNGVKLQIWGANESATAQRFYLIKETEETGTKTVDNGYYKILTKLNTSRSFDIDCGSFANGAMAQLWQDYNKLQQKFKIEYVDNGYYKIISANSKKALTVSNRNTRRGTLIVQQDDSNLDTQLWIIKNGNNGTHRFISKIGNMALMVNSGNDGEKLILGPKDESINNEFILVKENIEENAVTSIQDGYYNITLNSGKTLEIQGAGLGENANAQIWEKSAVQHHKFHITRVPGTNYYKISAVHSAKYLQVENSSIYDGANVTQGYNNNQSNQYWYIIDSGNGYYSFVSKLNGLYLKTSNRNSNGSNIFVGYNNNSYDSKFRLINVNIVEKGPFEIQTKLDSNKVLDIDRGSTYDNANVQIWIPQNTNQERFTFEAITNDTFLIKNVNSGKVLTLTNNGNVVQYQNYQSINQKWKVIERGDNCYSFKNLQNGYCLDLDNARTDNGTNVKTWWDNGNDAQKFRLVTGYRKFYEYGIYGTSGKKQANQGGYDLEYYKIGQGRKKFFAAFSIHGFEDSYSYDGQELTYMANEFKKYLVNNISEKIVNEWTIYILPTLNPDGQRDGWSNDGPGRTSLYSYAPNNHGIDLNRCWSVGFEPKYNSRNYTGGSPFLAPEATQLRDFILNNRGSQNIVIDTHGWLNETIGDSGIGSFYRNEFGISKHIATYGKGYFINWARSIANTRSMLLELPEVSSHSQVLNWNYVGKFINASMRMLENN